jgi:hypothetical protein
MAPTNSNRKKPSKSPAQRMHRPELVGTEAGCGCPACAERERELQELVTLLTDTGRTMREADHPLVAEANAAMIAVIEPSTDGTFTEMLESALSRLAGRAPEEALAVGLALRVVAPGRLAAIAGDLADGMLERGVARPGWADDLGQPLRGEDFHWLTDNGSVSLLAAAFRRGGSAEGFLIAVDPEDCDEAMEITPIDGSVAEALETLRAAAARDGVRLRDERLQAAEFRWRAANALDARLLHEEACFVPDPPVVLDEDEVEVADPFEELDLLDEDEDDSDENEARFAAMELVLRRRLAVLPEPAKPPAPHGTGGDDCSRDLAASAALQVLDGAGGTMTEVFEHAARAARERRWRAPADELPARPPRGDTPAPVYQLKVTLRGAWPPIWRRVEVPADLALDRLHQVLRVAFGWHDVRMHVFETPYGTFGARDPGLGWQTEAQVALEQVLPAEGDGIRYTYDLGDNWEHDITLERVVPTGAETGRPRCTGGRRAAPPEGCGGVFGYRDLLDTLDDPEDPGHEEQVEWLGLRSAREFDPDHFDAQEISARLAARL